MYDRSHEVFCNIRLRLGKNFENRTLFNDAAALHDRYLIANFPNDRHLMSD